MKEGFRVETIRLWHVTPPAYECSTQNVTRIQPRAFALRLNPAPLHVLAAEDGDTKHVLAAHAQYMLPRSPEASRMKETCLGKGLDVVLKARSRCKSDFFMALHAAKASLHP